MKHSPVGLVMGVGDAEFWQQFHSSLSMFWFTYLLVWVWSYFVPMPEALFSVKALVGVSLATAFSGEMAGVHASRAEAAVPPEKAAGDPPDD